MVDQLGDFVYHAGDFVLGTGHRQAQRWQQIKRMEAAYCAETLMFFRQCSHSGGHQLSQHPCDGFDPRAHA